MGGIFGVASKKDCVDDLFFGTDYHSHLGTRRGGMAVANENGFDRAIHNIENSPFRTKFERDVQDMKGTLGIGCISDCDPQPLIVRAHFGNFVVTTVGRINNSEELINRVFNGRRAHFMEMSSGKINSTELVASIIAAQDSLLEGIRAAQKMVDGSLTMLVMT
ncbi:MAG: amidophosphoribosyltransferase, partial [Eubacterium sp.]